MKKVVLGLLVITLFLMCMPLPIVQAEVEVADGLGFRLNSDGNSYSVYGYGMLSGNITIPAEFKGKPVTTISSKGFCYYLDVTSIEIPDSVTTIGAYAFAGCVGVTSVVLPGSITSIGECAFNDCPGMTSITIPDSVTSIGDCAFHGCTGLTTVTIPDSVTSFGNEPFRACNIQTIYCSKNSEAAKMAAQYNIPATYLCNTHSWAETARTDATCQAAGSISYVCQNCDETKQEPVAKLTEHTYSNACDTDCSVCGQTRSITHSYESAWSKDEAGHWYACSGCEEKDSYAEHEFEDACDPDCSVCGYTRETKHTYEDKWTSNEINHWHVCTVCGLKADETTHEPGAEATETTAQTCTLCGYEIASALGSKTTEPTAEPTDTIQSTTPDKQDPSVGSNFPWWIVLVAIVVVGGSIAVFVVIKKKKN